MLPNLKTLLLGIALLGCAPRGWTQDGTVVAWGDNRTGQGTVPSGLRDVVAIASGEWHNLVLKTDGTVYAWGYNAGVPWDVNNVVAIGAGGYHNMAIKADGTVRAWGANDYGQINVPAGLNNVVSVKGGWVHSLALKADGTVVAWGRHTEGQTNIPAGLNNVVAIAAGEYHNLALKSDGTVVGWGYNGFGQANIPHTVGNNVVAIAAGGLHSLVLKSDGTVVAWGWNQYGQATVPAGLRDVVAIAGGAEHSLALKSDGTVVGWGANDGWASNDPSCAMVNGTPCPRKYTGQIDVPAGLNNVVAIAAGVFHSIALTAENVAPAPPAPALSIRAVNDTSVRLSWIDLADETGYRLEARVGASGNWTEIATPGANATSYLHAGLTPGTTMFYRLRAFNTGGTSPYSAEVTATTSGAPAPVAPTTPTLSTTGNSHSTIALAWSDVANETGYKLEVKNSAGAWTELATLGAGMSTFNHDGLNASTAYTYRISAFNAAGSSAPSTELTVTTQPPPLQPPTAPTLSTTGNSHSTIALAWSDVANESGYKLDVKNSAGAWTELATLGAGMTTFNHDGLNASTAYTYRISAFNAAGSSAPSTELTVTTQPPPLQPPTAPTLSSTANSHSTVGLAWSDVANETGYKLEVKNSAGAWAELATLGAGLTTFSHDGLDASTAYTYRISAFNAAGSSALSSELTVTTQPPPLLPPATPTLSTTGNSHSTIALAWSDVANESGYKLEVKNSAGAWTELATLAADLTTFNHEGLNASAAYTYRIGAFNAAGSSALSSELTVTTQPPPLQPPTQPVLAGTVASHTSLNLHWGDVANATEFRLERRLATSTTWAEVAQIPAGTTNHLDTELSASTTYVYRLRAFNAAGFSAYSEELRLTTAAPPLQPPVAPVLQAQALSHAQVALSWTAVENETGFTLERRDGTGGNWVTISSPGADAGNYVDTQVSPSTTYAYRIAATNAAGSSGYSGEVNVITPAAPVLPPASPSLQATAISPTEVRLQWSDVANEVNYLIEGRLDAGSAWTTVTTLDADVTSFSDSGLTPETTYVYRIRAANSGGESAWIEATVRTPAKPLEVQASVNFVRVDDQTSGLWPLEFGTDGRWIASQSPDLPAGVGVTVLPETPVVWAADSSEARALIGAGGTNRVAAGWNGGPLTLNLSIPRGTPRRIALYFVDWHRTGASQQVSIRDATTGTNLDTRSIEAFGDGKYLVYDIDGNVEVTLNSSEGDAVLSGIFVGGGLPAPISNNPLTFRVLGADPNGMRVRISGDSGQRFKVQRTTDFRNWTDAANSILLSPSTDMALSGEVTGGFFRTVNTQ